MPANLSAEERNNVSRVELNDYLSDQRIIAPDIQTGNTANDFDGRGDKGANSAMTN